MVRLKVEGGFIRLIHITYFIFPLKNKKAGIIIFQSMDVGNYYIKTIHFSSQPTGNSCRMFIMVLMDELSAKSSIIRLDKFPIEFFKVIHTLEQSHWVRMHFLYIFKFNTGINHQDRKSVV